MSSARARWLRLGLLAAFIAIALGVGELTGLRKELTIARIRELTLGAGALGVVIYTLAFIIGEVIHVPGLLFVVAAVAIWGRLWGGVIAWVASTLSITASFMVVRALGGRVLARVQQPWFRRVLQRLEARPIRTVALLRAVLVISPPVTYALALSPVRFFDFFVGSAIGLLLPMAVTALCFDQLLRWLGH